LSFNPFTDPDADKSDADASSTHDKTAVVLLSGGLDSATTAAIAQSQGYQPHALTFDYGQRHRVELDAARAIAKHLRIRSHRWINIDFRVFGQSALTSDLEVPKDRHEHTITGETQTPPSDLPTIPATYVPARNTIFLAYALALAEVVGSADIFIGANAVDYSGYPDCRPAFIDAFEKTANLATKAALEGQRITLHAPLIDMPKTQIIQKGLELGVDYSLTHSCYDPGPQGKACGRCDSCILRKHAFEKLGMADPALE